MKRQFAMRAAACATALCALLLSGGVATAQTTDGMRPPVRTSAPTTEVPAVVSDVAASQVKTVGTDAKQTAGTKPLESSTEQVTAEEPVVPKTLEHVSGPALASSVVELRAPARRAHVPRMRWQHMEGHTLWTRAALSALKDHGKPLVEMVPRDIANWCPAYPTNDDALRRAFWVGYMSALAKHESTYKPWAVGGGGKWYGLLQILPATARGYKCNVGTGEALKNGAANLSCGVRIMAYTVKRDGVIHGRDKKWRGVSADWGPMRSPSKRKDMATWLKRQNYCQLTNTQRPRARP